MLVSLFGVVAVLYLVLDKRGCVYSYNSPFARKKRYCDLHIISLFKMRCRRGKRKVAKAKPRK